MKLPKINLKELDKQRRQILQERKDISLYWLLSITKAEWFASKDPHASIAVAIRTSEVLVLNREMDMTSALKAESKIVDSKIKLVFETLDMDKVVKIFKRAERNKKKLKKEGIREV